MIDFKALNRNLPTLQVIQSLGLKAHSWTCERWRGRCPFHDAKSKRSRSLKVDLCIRKWHCHRCKLGGDLIDLWAGVRGITPYRAAVELTRHFG